MLFLGQNEELKWKTQSLGGASQRGPCTGTPLCKTKLPTKLIGVVVQKQGDVGRTQGGLRIATHHSGRPAPSRGGGVEPAEAAGLSTQAPLKTRQQFFWISHPGAVVAPQALHAAALSLCCGSSAKHPRERRGGRAASGQRGARASWLPHSRPGRAAWLQPASVV